MGLTAAIVGVAAGAMGAAAISSSAQKRAAKNAEELARETGPETRRLLDEIAARQGKTGEELFREEGGDLGKILSEQAISGKPTEMFEPELELTRQMVNAEANRRGVFGGLPEA